MKKDNGQAFESEGGDFSSNNQIDASSGSLGFLMAGMVAVDNFGMQNLNSLKRKCDGFCEVVKDRIGISGYEEINYWMHEAQWLKHDFCLSMKVDYNAPYERIKFYITAILEDRLIKCWTELRFRYKQLLKNKQAWSSETIDLNHDGASDKIHLLQIHGVLAFLQSQSPFSLSMNALSVIICAITGESSQGIRLHISGHLNPQKNKGDSRFVKENNPDLDVLNSQDSHKLVDLGHVRATKKVIFFHLLGVLNFLKTKQPFQSSTNALASVIGEIMGENPATIQSYINPILNPEADQKNNPMMRERSVKEVKLKLQDLGFSIE